MAVVDLVELGRLTTQRELDSSKSAEERNRLGQFATPTALADSILECAESMLPRHLKVRFLDPAFGTGAFYSALLRAFPQARIEGASAYEIDPHYGQQAADIWRHTALKLTISDFTRAIAPPEDRDRANLVICNPPYVRHQHLSAPQKSRLQELAERQAGIRLNGLSGLYCYFLLICHGWLTDGGLAGWLVPSEFMDVNYGREVKRYLLNRVTLLRVHRFDPEDVQFADALVSSSVVWFKNCLPPRGHLVEFTQGGSLAEPRTVRRVPPEALYRTPKWSSLPSMSPADLVQSERSRLSDLFWIKRGIATGGNEFFMLSADDATVHQIPASFLQPILPSPRFVPQDEIETDEVGNPVLDRRLFLLRCDLPESEVAANHPSLWEYLQRGVDSGVRERYLCKHRSPWYSQENREPPLFLCTYMGRRDRRNGAPFRFILNHSCAIAPNVYLMLYPKPPLDSVLRENPDLRRLVWNALRELPMDELIRHGRVYGGGLHKLEPKELANAPASSVLSALMPFLKPRVEQKSLFDGHEDRPA